MIGITLVVLAASAEPAEVGTALQAAEARGFQSAEPIPELTPPTVVLDGGIVMTAAGDIHEPGYVVLRDGKIEAVGAGAAPKVEGARVLDVSERWVTPGLIDTHSHLGVYPSPWARAHSDGNEATGATTGGVWAEHSVWPQDPGFYRALAGGVTSLQILPGSANLIGGRGVVMRVTPARGSRNMRFPGAPETVKMACGENPKRVYGERGGPATRMGNVAGHRAAFFRAEAYQRKWSKYQDELEAYEKNVREAEGKKKKKASEPSEPPDPPDRDLELDTLVGVLEGRILPQIHCYRADDMLSVLQIADEFGWRVRSFHHALEAYKIRDILAERDIAVSTWADWWGFKMEAYDGVPQNLAMVASAGGRAVVHSDSASDIQRLNQEAAKAWRAGRDLGFDHDANEVLRWITYNPAWALGIEDEVGTLEPGKRADVVVWSHDPFSVYATARWVFMDGLLRYDVDRPATWSDFEVGQGVMP